MQNELQPVVCRLHGTDALLPRSSGGTPLFWTLRICCPRTSACETVLYRSLLFLYGHGCIKSAQQFARSVVKFARAPRSLGPFPVGLNSSSPARGTGDFIALSRRLVRLHWKVSSSLFVACTLLESPRRPLFLYLLSRCSAHHDRNHAGLLPPSRRRYHLRGEFHLVEEIAARPSEDRHWALAVWSSSPQVCLVRTEF